MTYQHNQVEQQLQQDKAFAEAANLNKSQFLAKVNHELRTPLNAIIGYSEILQEHVDHLDQAQVIDYGKRIEQCGRNLTEMIGAITEIAKIEAGQKSYNIDLVSVREFVDKLEFLAQMIFEKSEQTFYVIHGKDLGSFRTDTVLLQGALTAILKTVAKSNPPGYVTLRIDRQKTYPKSALPSPNLSGEWISFHICEQITEQQVQSTEFVKPILAPNKEMDILDDRPDLAISYRFCQLIGGSITVSTPDEAGSVISIHIPTQLDKQSRTHYG